MKIRFLPIIMLLIWIFSSCSWKNNENKDELEISAVTDSFACHYYCWKFKDAAAFSSSDFQKQLKFLSSNVNASDIEILKNSTETPEFSIDAIHITDNENADVLLNLNNIYVMDSIGSKPLLLENATQHLFLNKENGQWRVDKVRMKEKGE